MLAVIRIKGMVKIERKVEETLNRLKLRRKYVCVVLREKPEILRMLRKVEHFVAYGEIDEKTLFELVGKRGKSAKKIDAKKIVSEFIQGKAFEELGLKSFFRLHPPRGGINTKKKFPNGALGNNGKEINRLIMRML